jgi:hypothetical protein
LTLALWVKASSFSNADWNSTLANVGLNEWINGYYGLAIDTTGKPIALLNIGDGPQNIFILRGAVLTPGQWHHLALTYDNSALRLYVNGVAAGELPINRTRAINPSPLILGKRGDTGFYLNGVLDDVRVSSRALAATEIAAIAQGTTATTSPSTAASATTVTTTSALLSSTTSTTSTLSSISSPTASTYRASTDFSGVQGQRNWFYLDSLGNRLTFNATTNVWQGSELYMLLGATDGHPGATLDAVRRWVAPGAGTVQITGTARDLNAGGGGGVTVSIRQGATVLWQQPLANGNTTGVTFNLTTTLAAGATLDFVINRGSDGNNAYDATAFDPTITFSPTTTTSTTSTTPPPTTGTASVTLSWNRNTEPDLSFYRVYYGTSSRNYSNSIGVGTSTASTISGLASGTIYYFALTAVDTSGNQSPYSQEVAISR